MTALSVRLPESLHAQLKQLARQEGVSINQLITLAVAEKVSALKTEDYFRERAAHADREAFLAILDKAPDGPPLPGDELP
ncbi:CopG family transcriptional regulator [Deinococcus aluminii]|uniref:Toxin-antitoxin system HicB family antitoxin n=1 Tax=Deinococcus aluminii TaxID=1656885 RepID=A0ABP9XJ46_9DEIO